MDLVSCGNVQLHDVALPLPGAVMAELWWHRRHIGQPKTETGRSPLQHLYFPPVARGLLKLDAGSRNPGLAGCGSCGDEVQVLFNEYGPSELGLFVV